MNAQKRKMVSLRNKIQELLASGPMLPGSISKQWNVCGNPNCRCKDKDNPKKHGPYYQLSFTIGGKSSSMFLNRDSTTILVLSR